MLREEIWIKIHSFSHASEVKPDWHERVWKGWDADHNLQNLNPAFPGAYPRAVRARSGRAAASAAAFVRFGQIALTLKRGEAYHSRQNTRSVLKGSRDETRTYC